MALIFTDESLIESFLCCWPFTVAVANLPEVSSIGGIRAIRGF